MNLSVRKLKNTAHLAIAAIANVINFFPSRDLKIIGVTGTDGKTTTANLIYHILKESGNKVAVISTIGAIIDGENYETGFHVTTPSPFAIQKYVKLAKDKGCTHLVLEVTSHALDQNRVWGIKFEIGVLTNITNEHLDYHRNYESYVNTKLKLIKNSKLAVVNSNGVWFEKVTKIISPTSLISYSLHGTNSKDLSIINMPYQIKTSLIGDFNLENILAATCVALALDIKPDVIDLAVESFEAPVGRQEIFTSKDGVTFMVDFAHTANSFENILPEVKKRISGRLFHVFGAAGERDREKRPEMGKVASYFDDVIILTSEDSRSEKIEEIIDQIKKGISIGKIVHAIPDRREAIEFAYQNAKKGDFVIITGKGHEKTMNLGGEEFQWSDQREVCRLLDST